MSKNSVKTKTSAAAEIFEWLEMVIVSACVVLLAFTFIARPARVDGHSMDKTLNHGEMLLISDTFYEPERNDVLVFQKINSKHPNPIVKRVIATEGETINLDFSKKPFEVTITDTNGETFVLEEPYCQWLPDRLVTSDLDYPITLGKDELFVMGDNRNNSLDSRDSDIGIVKENEIIGKVLLRVFPFNKFGTIN